MRDLTNLLLILALIAVPLGWRAIAVTTTEARIGRELTHVEGFRMFFLGEEPEVTTGKGER